MIMVRKTKKANKWLPLVILAAVMIALFFGYKALSQANERKAAEEAAREAEAETVIVVADDDPAGMTSLSYGKKGEDRISFVRSGNTWMLDGDEHFPLDTELVESMAAAVSSISALRTVDEGVPADYGLDDPAYLIETAYSDGTHHTYGIGDYNAFGGGYYFSADGSISMISDSLLKSIGYTLEDLAELDTIPSYEWTSEDVVSSVTVQLNGEETCITDKDTILQITRAINQLVKLNDCVDYYADAEEKDSLYGRRDAVTATVAYKEPVKSTAADGTSTAAYMDKTYTIWFGNQSGDGTCYGGPDASDLVYALDESAKSLIEGYIGYTGVSAPEETAETVNEND